MIKLNSITSTFIIKLVKFGRKIISVSRFFFFKGQIPDLGPNLRNLSFVAELGTFELKAAVQQHSKFIKFGLGSSSISKWILRLPLYYLIST